MLNRFGAGVSLMVVSAVGSTTLAARQFGAVSVQTGVVLGAWFLMVSAYMALGAFGASGDPRERRRGR